LAKWYSLTNEEIDRLNPPYNVGVFPDWLPVGHIPRPTTLLGWFAYHVIHGLWMRYPLHKVLGYALANSQPGEMDYRDFELPTITLPSGDVVEASRVEWTPEGPRCHWDVPMVVENDSAVPADYVTISATEVAKYG
jgi:hypothetical protein